MLRCILFATLMLASAQTALANKCDPVAIGKMALEPQAGGETDLLENLARARAQSIYPERFVRFLAPEASSESDDAGPPPADRWKPQYANTRKLSAGAPVRILTSLPRRHRLYLFYAKQSDGEIRLIFPNKYEGTGFALPEEAEPASSEQEPWTGNVIAGPQAAYLLQLAAAPDRYVVLAMVAGEAPVPQFEEALRLWFDPREPFPLMRKDKGAFAEFLNGLTENCGGRSFQTQRMFINTLVTD